MKILLTGATGYIGRRLMYRLVEHKDIELRLLVRNAKKIEDDIKPQVEIVEGDTFDRDKLRSALQGVDVAYYLIHSMGSLKDFEELDRLSATNFRDIAIECGVKKIIYLGGLGEKEKASKHLRSRIETGEILSAFPDKIQTIWFRAGIIIGSGSASFEIISNLVIKLPVLVSPRFIKNKTQPIGIADVLLYLDNAIALDYKENLVVDIGSEEMTFEALLRKMAEILKVDRVIFTVPVFSATTFAYGIIFLTPVSKEIATRLIDSLMYNTVKLNDNAEKYFSDIKPISYELAVKNAFKAIGDKRVISRWSDSSAGPTCDIIDKEDTSYAIFIDSRSFDFGDIPKENMFESILSIGGENGWFSYDILWEIRGIIDNMLGGQGLSGKRETRTFRIGDSWDIWKVVDIRKNKRLLLGARMRLPGKAWLEFVIEDKTLKQTAYYLPYGVWGYFYWFILKPFHFFIFRDLAKSIINKAREMPVVNQ